MADHQEQNPHVTAAALQLQLKVAHEGQARLATQLAEAQIAHNELVNQVHVQNNQINQLTQSNVSMLAAVNTANEGREEFRTLLSEKIGEETQARDNYQRAMLYADYFLVRGYHGSASKFPFPFVKNPKQYKRTAVLPSNRMVSVTSSLTEVVAFCDNLYQNIPTHALRELLKV